MECVHDRTGRSRSSASRVARYRRVSQSKPTRSWSVMAWFRAPRFRGCCVRSMAFDRRRGGWVPRTDGFGRCSLPGSMPSAMARGSEVPSRPLSGRARRASRRRMDAGGCTSDTFDRSGSAALALASKLWSVRRCCRRHDGAAPAHGDAIVADTVVCRCEDVTRGEIEAALATARTTSISSSTSPAAAWVRARVGCAATCGELLALACNVSRETVGHWTGRPPLRPVPLDGSRSAASTTPTFPFRSRRRYDAPLRPRRGRRRRAWRDGGAVSARGGMRVALIERDQICREASGVNAGTLTMQMTRVALIPYALQAHAMWASRAANGSGTMSASSSATASRSPSPSGGGAADLPRRQAPRGGCADRASFPATRACRSSRAYRRGARRRPVQGRRLRQRLPHRPCLSPRADRGRRDRCSRRRGARRRAGERRLHGRHTAAGHVRAKRLVLAGGVWIEEMVAWLGVHLPIKVLINQLAVTERIAPVMRTVVGIASGCCR